MLICGGITRSGRSRTVVVVGAYWMSSRTLVAQHDLSGRDGEVPADAKRAPVDLRRQAAVVPPVADEVARAPVDAAACGLEGALEGRGVADQRVGRSQRLEEQRQGEPAARATLRVEIELVDQAEQRLAPREVALHAAAIDRLLAKGRVGEAALGGRRLALRSAGARLPRARARRRAIGAPARADERARVRRPARPPPGAARGPSRPAGWYPAR